MQFQSTRCAISGSKVIEKLREDSYKRTHCTSTKKEVLENINDFIRLLNNLTAKEGLGLTKVKVVHIIHNIKVNMIFITR